MSAIAILPGYPRIYFHFFINVLKISPSSGLGVRSGRIGLDI